MTQLIKGVELRKQTDNNINNKTKTDKVLLNELLKQRIDKLFDSLEKLSISLSIL